MRARKSRQRGGSLAAAASAAAARPTSGRAAGLIAFPLFDRFAAEPPVAADAESGQASLPEQPIDGRRMNAEMFRQFLDGENLIALSYLSHTFGGFTWRRPFLHSLRPLTAQLTMQALSCVVELAESRHFVRTAGDSCLRVLVRALSAISEKRFISPLSWFKPIYRLSSKLKKLKGSSAIKPPR